MIETKKFTKQTRASVRQGVVQQRRVNRALDNEIDTYRAQVKQKFDSARRSERPRTMIAEGDSWFRYMVGKALIFYIAKRPRNEILNLAAPGDEVRDMLTPKQKKRLVRELRRGPTRNRKYDAFLFSGGGNDLLGEGRFRLWLNDFVGGMNEKDLINRTATNRILAYVADRYEEIIGIRDQFSPKTRMYFHGYDIAQPHGKGVCGMGPWLEPGLIERNIPKRLHVAVVEEFLRLFAVRLQGIANKHKNNRVTFVNTQGTLMFDEWANEIHPKNSGFKKIADRIATVVEADLP